MTRRSNKKWKSRVPAEVIKAVIENANGRCEWCFSSDHCGIDHIIPKGQGGPHKLWNFQYLCDRCGNWKAHDLPCQVLMRIECMRCTSIWAANVKSHGFRIMSDFISNGHKREVEDVELPESNSSDEPVVEMVEITGFAVFPNPLEVNLGEGRIAMSAFSDRTEAGVAHGIVLSFHDGTSHEIGEAGPKLADGGPKEGQVYIRCLNARSAKALASVVAAVVDRFAVDENSATDEAERALNTLVDIPQSQG
jgi:hypothetical protein